MADRQEKEKIEKSLPCSFRQYEKHCNWTESANSDDQSRSTSSKFLSLFHDTNSRKLVQSEKNPVDSSET